jgi:Recombinase-like helix-turn-helix domain
MISPPPDVHTRLASQALARELSPAEEALATALELSFRTNGHDIEDLVRALREKDVKRPSGATEPWSLAALESELATINASLDAAYLARGPIEADQT